MSFVTVAYAIAIYLAVAIAVAGLAYRIYRYATIPAPLRIPITPAPLTRGGAALRVAREVVLFESLFKASKWTWLFGAMFHAALALVVLAHLRFVVQPVWGWVVLIQPFGKYAGFALVLGLAGLWARRLLIDRIRYISQPSDHLMIALLMAIGLSGLAMRFVSRVDIVAAKGFVLGLVYFDWQPLPADPPLLAHLALVVVLMAVFPFSKLLHAPGIFFSPTRNQADDARDRRHLAPWAAALEAERDR